MFIHKNTPLLITFTMQITTWMFKNPSFPEKTCTALYAIHAGDQMRSRRAILYGKLFNKETNFIRVESSQKRSFYFICDRVRMSWALSTLTF